MRELFGVMAAEHAVGGFVVASGKFTEAARRFACPLDAMPVVQRVVAACEALPAFHDAAPERQPDAE